MGRGNRKPPQAHRQAARFEADFSRRWPKTSSSLAPQNPRAALPRFACLFVPQAHRKLVRVIATRENSGQLCLPVCAPGQPAFRPPCYEELRATPEPKVSRV
jgi:hypothetical protein